MSRNAPGYFCRLAVDYFDDPRVIEAGEAAEVLFVRTIAFCRRTLSDGHITDEQLRRLGLRNVAKRAEKLVDVGLFVRDTRGFRVANYLRWNESRDDVEKARQQNAARQKAYRSRRNGVRNASRDALVTRPENRRDIDIGRDDDPSGRSSSLHLVGQPCEHGEPRGEHFCALCRSAVSS